MSPRAASRVAWSLWVVEIVTVGVLVPWDSSGGLLANIAGVVFIVVFATTGALVASRRPGNPIGWLMCLSAFAFTLGAVSVEIVEQAARGEGSPLVTLAAWLSQFVWLIGIAPAATFLLLLFPDGRLPSRRWRPLAWLSAAALALTVVGLAFAPGLIQDSDVPNPVGIPGGAAVLDAMTFGGLMLLFVSILAAWASLVVRYRQAGPEQRQQIKWIAYAVPLLVVMVMASALIEALAASQTSADIANALASTGLVMVPVAIGIAMLRYRLYDVDVVINRTLVYGALTVTLAAVYLGGVLLLQLALSPLTGEFDLAIAGSTLAVAALFRPARSRIQAAVDRRFYRHRYDARHTVEAFTGRLRQQVDLDAVAADLQGVVRDTVEPTHLSLWLRGAR